MGSSAGRSGNPFLAGRRNPNIFDTNGTAVLWDQTWLRRKSPKVVEHAKHHYNFAWGTWDTTYTYFTHDDSNRITKVTTLPDETPIRNGSEFIYSGGRISRQVQYAGGTPITRSEYLYSGIALTTIVSRDTSGNWRGTTKFEYSSGRLTARVRSSQDYYERTAFKYLSKDTVEMQSFDSLGKALSYPHILILKDGRIIRQNDYDEGGLFGYSEWDHAVSARIPRRIVGGSRPGTRQRELRDFLGRIMAPVTSGTDPLP